MITTLARATVAAFVLACTIALPAAQATQSREAALPDLTGSWERVGPGTLGRGQGTDPRTPPPVPLADSRHISLMAFGHSAERVTDHAYVGSVASLVLLQGAPFETG